MFKSLICAAAVAAIATPAFAAVEVDQVNLTAVPTGTILTGVALNYQPSFTVSRLGQMQSVTAGKKGLLTGVDLQLFRYNNANSDLAFSVSLVDGEPGTSGAISVIGSREFVKSNLPLAATVVDGEYFMSTSPASAIMWTADRNSASWFLSRPGRLAQWTRRLPARSGPTATVRRSAMRAI